MKTIRAKTIEDLKPYWRDDEKRYVIPGNLEWDGDMVVNGSYTVEGAETVGGDQYVGGDQDVRGDQDVGGDQYVRGDQDVGGDQYVRGDQDVGGDLYWNKPTAAENVKVGGVIWPTQSTRKFWVWALRAVPAVAKTIESGACYERIAVVVAENRDAVAAVAADENSPPVVRWVIESWLNRERNGDN